MYNRKIDLYQRVISFADVLMAPTLSNERLLNHFAVIAAEGSTLFLT
jgi:hypothetical protein